jgi:hypothetical protein
VRKNDRRDVFKALLEVLLVVEKTLGQLPACFLIGKTGKFKYKNAVFTHKNEDFKV